MVPSSYLSLSLSLTFFAFLALDSLERALQHPSLGALPVLVTHGRRQLLLFLGFPDNFLDNALLCVGYYMLSR